MHWRQRKKNSATRIAGLLGLALLGTAKTAMASPCDTIPGCRAELARLDHVDTGHPEERRVGRTLVRLARRVDRQLTLAETDETATAMTHLARAEALLDRMGRVAGRAYVAGTLGRGSAQIATAAVHLATLLDVSAVGVAPASYTNNCAVCHGATAQGGIGPNLQCRRNIAGAVRNGIGSMPAFTAAQVSDADIVAIEAWLASFCATTTSTLPRTTTTTSRPPSSTTTTTSRPPSSTTTTTRPSSSTTVTTRPAASTTSTTGPVAGSTTTTTRPPGRGDDDDDDGEDDHDGGSRPGHRRPGGGHSGRLPGTDDLPGGNASGAPSARECRRMCASVIRQCPRGHGQRRACRRAVIASCQLDAGQACLASTNP